MDKYVRSEENIKKYNKNNHSYVIGSITIIRIVLYLKNSRFNYEIITHFSNDSGYIWI